MSGRVWFDEPGTYRRHASAIRSHGESIAWVAASGKEFGDEDFTVANLRENPYTVRLHFAELEEGVGPGGRVFDVSVNGTMVLNDFDIVAETGGAFRGVVREFTVTPEERSITIGLRRSDGSELSPLLNGVEVIAW